MYVKEFHFVIEVQGCNGKINIELILMNAHLILVVGGAVGFMVMIYENVEVYWNAVGQISVVDIGKPLRYTKWVIC